MMATERYDIVIFGASGFTGQFVVEEVARVAPTERLTWSVSGRSMEKIQKVLSKASKRTGNTHIKNFAGLSKSRKIFVDQFKLQAMHGCMLTKYKVLCSIYEQWKFVGSKLQIWYCDAAASLFFCLFAGNDLESTPIIIADTSSDESLLQMAKQAKLVLNCVGPVSEARISPQSAIICCKLFFKCLKINKSIQSTWSDIFRLKKEENYRNTCI